MSAAEPPRARSIIDRFTIAAFLLAIGGPGADELLRPDEARGPAPELRVAAPRPALPTDFQTLSDYPAQYDRYINDTFGLRDVLLRAHSIVKLMLFGVPPAEQVIVGQHGWLFYTGDSSVDVFRGLMPFSECELERWRQMLEARRDFLRARGIEYLFVIAPNKESIYPEHMPARFNVLGPTRLDQFVDYMGARSDLDLLDLRPVLRAKKLEDVPDDWLYARLGSHWDGRGAYEAYRAIVERLARRFPGMVPFERADLQQLVQPGYGDTWGTRMYIEDLLPQRATQYSAPDDPRWGPGVSTMWGRKTLTVFSMDDPSFPRALLYHDSFGPYVEHLLSHHFASLQCAWRSDFDTVLLEEAAPDVVIELFVERILVKKSPDEPTPTARHTDRDAYERSSDVRWTLEPASATGGLVSEGTARVERASRGDAPCLSIDRRTAFDRVFVPEFDTQSARSLVMCADIDTRRSTLLTVLYLAPGETEYKHRYQVRALLRAGPNRVFLRLDPLKFHGRLVLHLGEALEGVTLCGLEIRAVD